MFVLTPHPCVLVCVRVCVCVPAAWIVWIASDTTLAGSRPRKEVDFVVSSPSREYRNTTASTRDETLVCFCLSCTNKQTVKQKDPFFLFFTFFFVTSLPENGGPPGGGTLVPPAITIQKLILLLWGRWGSQSSNPQRSRFSRFHIYMYIAYFLWILCFTIFFKIFKTMKINISTKIN